MKNFLLSLSFLIICVSLFGCGNRDEHPLTIPANTSSPPVASTVIPTFIPTRISSPTPTNSLYFPPYSTKQFILNYCVSGWHGNFDIFTDTICWPLLILYKDGQMIITGETYQQKFLSEEEIEQFLAQLQSKGLYTLETNQQHDPTDQLYDFGNHYERIYDGLYYCIAVRDVEHERNLCAHDPQREYLIAEMKSLLGFLDKYQLEGATVYYPDRILLSIETGRNPYISNLPEQSAPWPEHLPPLETAEYNTIYAEGEMALEIYALFDNTDSFRVFTQRGKEYTLEIEPVLPHEVLTMP
jgi:hypothetical protein